LAEKAKYSFKPTIDP